MLNPSSKYNADANRITAELQKGGDGIDELKNDTTFGDYF
jgi:hypothetical protein